MKTDTVISILISMAVSLILSLPAIYCCKMNKSPFDIKPVGFLYFLYFSFMAALYVSRFAYFASTTLNPDAQAWIFVGIVTVCALYASTMGIEGIGRFSAFVFVLLMGAAILVLGFSTENFDTLNLYPVMSNSLNRVGKNILLMSSSTGEIALFLCLQKKVNGSAVKPFLWSVVLSFLTIFVLFLYVVAVMGDAAALQAFPLGSFFQTAKIGLFERFDVLYSSFWIMGIFIKAALFIYCASLSFKPFKNRTKCIASAGIVFLAALYISEFTMSGMTPAMTYTVPFAVFCVFIPAITLIFKKRNYGDELVERF